MPLNPALTLKAGLLTNMTDGICRMPAVSAEGSPRSTWNNAPAQKNSLLLKPSSAFSTGKSNNLTMAADELFMATRVPPAVTNAFSAATPAWLMPPEYSSGMDPGL